MDFKSGTGKCCILAFSLAFSLGFWISIFSPSWLTLAYRDSSGGVVDGGYVESRLGPFYGQTRTCTSEGVCFGWQAAVIDISDCDAVKANSGELLGDYCLMTNTWRGLAICCFVIQFFAALLICLGVTCQAFTCGGCGASFDLIAMLLFWIEVFVSIVAWSFGIVSVNMVNNSEIEGVSSGYEWGFWLFIATGTILGAICAWLTDW
eukprot:CAMPEP_0113565964 /NCGR_PEP_ID=MMETSP0015_2-20120614/22463_1 /TAXON_ID=2838 /ORGANISM="Odontella" /LENGTH=205 /DNA_ID=CAMNT_0000468207 /DNA_START=159 /DNA_END=773 /DNA_ORIENTATION=- /assembly_acc=CAM_ASM_000160